MADTARSQGNGQVKGKAAADRRAHWHAPRQWIYENLTPWRIHACFTAHGELLPRGGDTSDADRVAKVLSIPALGSVNVPPEDARKLNTLNMRRLGQIELRPAPSEVLEQHAPRHRDLRLARRRPRRRRPGRCSSAVPARCRGRGSSPPSSPFPVIALIVATVREIHLYRRFEHVPRGGRAARRRSRASSRAAGSGRSSTACPATSAEVAVLVGAVRRQRRRPRRRHPPDDAAQRPPADRLRRARPARQPVRGRRRAGPQQPGVLAAARRPHRPVGARVGRRPGAGGDVLPVRSPAAGVRPAAMDRRRCSDSTRRCGRCRTSRPSTAPRSSRRSATSVPDSGLRLGSGRRSPVIVATILLVVGWFLVISATKVPRLVADGPASSRGRRRAADGSGGSFPVSTFFRPELSLDRLRVPRRVRLHAVPRAPRLPAPRPPPEVVQHDRRADPGGLRPGARGRGSSTTAPGPRSLLFFVGFTPESALVWLREKMSEDSGIWKAVPASRAGAAHRTSRGSTSTTAPASPRRASTTSRRWPTPTSSTS